MSWSPLSSFCDDVAYITTAAFVLSLPELPDPSGSRDDIYLDVCIVLNTIFDNGQIDGVFYDYLSMHLDHAFAQGGVGGLQ